MEGQTSVEEEGEGNLNVDSESLTLQLFNHGEDSGYRLKTTTTTWHCFRSISICVLKKKKISSTVLEMKTKPQTMNVKSLNMEN